jgi:hypothetical protein
MSVASAARAEPEQLLQYMLVGHIVTADPHQRDRTIISGRFLESFLIVYVCAEAAYV